MENNLPAAHSAANPDSAMYALVFDEAKRALARQEVTLDNLRGRSATLIPAAALVTSFLGAAAIRGEAIGLWGFLAIAALIAVGATALLVLSPWPGWVFRNSPEGLLRHYVEADDQATIAEMHRDVALHMENHFEHNESLLGRLYWGYRLGAVLLLLNVLFWLAELFA